MNAKLYRPKHREEALGPLPSVRWHKKGCKTCQPIVIPTRQTPLQPLTPAPDANANHTA